MFGLRLAATLEKLEIFQSQFVKINENVIFFFLFEINPENDNF